jgi:hypothetical protein
MNKERFHQYIADFNKGDYREVLSTYYAEDAILETPDVRYEGLENVIDFFIRSHKGVKEFLTVTNLLIDGDGVAAELEAEMKVTLDRPDHHIRPLKKGDTMMINQCALYDVKDSRIRHVRVYRRKVAII